MNSVVSKFVGGVCLCGALMAWQRLDAQQQFASPEDASKALATAVEARDTNALDTIFGPEIHSLMSADPVQASNRFNLFARRISQKAAWVRQSDDKLTLDIGYDGWPFPIPLERHDGQWAFDVAAGREEILCRRIGENELGAIAVCHSYVDAQREYASTDRENDGIIQYARQLRSTPGKHNGLYWHAAPGEPASPFGPLIAAAHGEGYRKTTRVLDGGTTPYHGYFYKILTRQGRAAPGGKFDYIIHGHMVAGFALVAWPAQWDNSGIMTFIVNQNGRVYERNLGPKTAALASAMTSYNPDSNWKPAQEP